MLKRAIVIIGLVMGYQGAFAHGLDSDYNRNYTRSERLMPECAAWAADRYQYYSCMNQVYAEKPYAYSRGAVYNHGWIDNSIPCSELVRWPELFWECQARNSP